MKKSVFLALSLVVVLVLSACDDDSGKKIAKVNGKGISEESFQAYLKHKRIPLQNESRVDSALDSFLEREALASSIEKNKLLGEANIEAELSEFKRQMLISRYFEVFLKDKVNEQAIKNFYASNPEQFETKKVRASHILLRTNPKMSDNEKQALLTKAHEIYSKAVAGEDFVELAKNSSEDIVSAKKGGDLGWLKQGSIDPVFSSKVFSMKAGDIAEPFATVFGFHIVRLDEEAQVVKKPFEKVRGDIRYQLRLLAKKAEVERLKDSANIEKY